MKHLITEITQLQEVVGGAVNKSVDIRSLHPYLSGVVRDYIIPHLGKQLIDDVIDRQDTIGDESLTLLLYYTRKAAGYLTLWKYADIAGVQLSDMGLLRSESENMKSAFKYQEAGYRNAMRDHGHEALEELIIFLQENATDYPLWGAERLANSRRLFLANATQFRSVYSRYISRYSYEILQPVIEDLEAFAIQPLLGDDFFYELKELVRLDTLTNQEKELVYRIRKAIANFAIEEGTKQHWIKISGNNIIQSEHLDQSNIEHATDAAINVSLRHHDVTGNRHLTYIQKFLKDNIDDFETYANWQAELEAAIDHTPEFELLPCGCVNWCRCDFGVVNF